MNLVTTQIESHLLHLCWPFLCECMVDFPLTSQQCSFLLLYFLFLILCNDCLCQQIIFQWKKINKFEIFNGSEGLCCGILRHSTVRIWNGDSMFFQSDDTDLQNDILSYQEGQYKKKPCNVITFSWIGYSHFLGNIHNSVQSNKNLGVVVSSAAKVHNVLGMKLFQSLCTF